MLRRALIIVFLFAAGGVLPAEAQTTGDGDAGEQSAPTPPARDCTTSVRNVRRALCPSRRQRVQICTGGGEGRTVTPLNCV